MQPSPASRFIIPPIAYAQSQSRLATSQHTQQLR